MIYEIIDNFDVWGNKKEGYFVNNAINTIAITANAQGLTASTNAKPIISIIVTIFYYF